MTRGSARSQWPAPRTTCSSEGPVAASARARASATGTSGSSEPCTMSSGRPLSSAASSAGCRTESSLAQASAEAGNPGVVMTPVWRQRVQQLGRVAGQRAEVGRRAEAGHPRHPLVAGGQVQRQHPAEAEADHEAGRRLGDLARGQEGQVLQPAQRGEVAR